MKGKVLALTLAGALAVSATAQEVTSDYLLTTPAKDVAFKPENKWFITLLGGVNYGLGFGTDGVKAGAAQFDFAKRLGYSAGFGFGQWHNPYFGTRLMIDWNWIANPYVAACPQGKGFRKAHSLNPHLDFMFDMSNYFAPYNPDRVFHFVPYIGVGYMGTQRLTADRATNMKMLKELDFAHSVSANAGINLDFRFTRNVALTLAPSVAVANFFEGYMANGREPLEVLPQLRAGLTFGIGNTAFEGVEPMDYELLNNLQGEVNALRSQNAELSKRPVRCPECPEVKPAPEAKPTAEAVVYFRIGSSNIDRNQLLNIYNIAEFVKANKAPIVVTGYADEKTGTAAYNSKLSEKRARKVADKLIKEYGVPSDLITIDYKGDTVQPYANNNAWNRVVIMKSK